jgi:hypothetical protein
MCIMHLTSFGDIKWHNRVLGVKQKQAFSFTVKMHARPAVEIRRCGLIFPSSARSRLRAQRVCRLQANGRSRTPVLTNLSMEIRMQRQMGMIRNKSLAEIKNWRDEMLIKLLRTVTEDRAMRK